MCGHLNYEFFVALIKPDSRKIEGYPLSNSSRHMQGRDFFQQSESRNTERLHVVVLSVILEIMGNAYMLHVLCTG